MIRKVNNKDKNIYIEMAKQFYCSEAVLHNIPDANFYKTFDEVTLNSPYADAYIYEHNGKVAGYVLVSITYSNESGGLVLWIEEIYILPEYQGNGFGKELLAFIEDTYKDKCVRIRLEVEKLNQKAIDLYQKSGYSQLEYLQMYKEYKAKEQ